MLYETIGIVDIEVEIELTSGVIGLFTGLLKVRCCYENTSNVEAYPHQISFSDPGSLTILLSNGERPVFAPEYAVRAPVDVMAEPVS